MDKATIEYNNNSSVELASSSVGGVDSSANDNDEEDKVQIIDVECDQSGDITIETKAIADDEEDRSNVEASTSDQPTFEYNDSDQSGDSTIRPKNNLSAEHAHTSDVITPLLGNVKDINVGASTSNDGQTIECNDIYKVKGNNSKIESYYHSEGPMTIKVASRDGNSPLKVQSVDPIPGIPRKQLAGIKENTDLINCLEDNKHLGPNNTWLLQYLAVRVGNKKIYQDILEFMVERMSKENPVCIYEPQEVHVRGCTSTNVTLKVAGDIERFLNIDVEAFRQILAENCGNKVRYTNLTGINKGCVKLFFQIPSTYKDILLCHARSTADWITSNGIFQVCVDGGEPINLPKCDNQGLSPANKRVELLSGIFSGEPGDLKEVPSKELVNSALGGKPFLHWACELNKTMWVQFLLDHGADVNATDEMSFTVLHRVALLGLTEMCKTLLLTERIDYFAKNMDRLSPSAIARDQHHKEIVRLFEVIKVSEMEKAGLRSKMLEAEEGRLQAEAKLRVAQGTIQRMQHAERRLQEAERTIENMHVYRKEVIKVSEMEKAIAGLRSKMLEAEEGRLQAEAKLRVAEGTIQRMQHAERRLQEAERTKENMHVYRKEIDVCKEERESAVRDRLGEEKRLQLAKKKKKLAELRLKKMVIEGYIKERDKAVESRRIAENKLEDAAMLGSGMEETGSRVTSRKQKRKNSIDLETGSRVTSRKRKRKNSIDLLKLFEQDKCCTIPHKANTKELSRLSIPSSLERSKKYKGILMKQDKGCTIPPKAGTKKTVSFSIPSSLESSKKSEETLAKKRKLLASTWYGVEMDMCCLAQDDKV